MTVLAFDFERRTSAHAIEDLARLGYLNENQHILDLTYGKGRFWRRWRPRVLSTNDINPEREAMFRQDYRTPYFAADWFDVVAFDPPFKLNGTGGRGPGDDSYGVEGAYDGDRIASMWLGLSEAFRVVKPGGLVLFKTQDQVSGGRKRWLSKIAYADNLADAMLLDELFIVGYRPQPTGVRQVHSRSNVSVLQVYRKAR